MDEQTEARAENSRESQKRERGLAALLRRAGLRIKNAFSKEKTIGKKRKKKRAVIACILVLVLAAGSFFGYRHFFGAEKSESIQTATAKIASVSNVIEGSGTVEAVNQYEITALVTGEILEDYFEEGQLMNKGDLMYRIDSTEMENSIKKAQQSLEKSQLSAQESSKALGNLTVYSGISGVIQELYVKNGDQIQNGGKVAEIVNTDYLKLKIKFNTADAQMLSVGSSAQINLESSFTTLYGTVESIASGSLMNEDGVPVTNVEISVANPGAIQPGERATAVVGAAACNSPGTFEYYESETVTAEASGKVTNLNYIEGDRIQAGARLISISSDSTVNSAKQSQITVQDAQISLQDQYDKLEDYSITAPISGKVIQKTMKAGEKLDNSTSKTTMAIIADLSTLIFEMSVDELDISDIQEGQEVEITADALEGQVFSGYVDNVSIVGTAQNGVTSYPVKVVVNDGEASGLIPGMNVNASIVVESRENVLTVPLSAINRGNLVYVKGSGSSGKETDSAPGDKAAERGGIPAEGGQPGEEQPGGNAPSGNAPSGENADAARGQNRENTNAGRQNANGAPSANTKANANVPDGFTAVKVEIGLSDDTNVEIISGLSEGDVVLLSDKTASASSQTNAGGMPGGMGGGMPGGGMPGGGAPGGGMGGGPRQ